MKLDPKPIMAALIGLTLAAGSAADASGQTANRHARPANGNVHRNTNVNRNVNYNRNVNVNRNVNTNWHGGGNWHNGSWNGGVWHAGYRGAGAVAAGAAAATAIAIGSRAYALPSGCGTVVVNGGSYYQCGSAWYQPQYMNGTTQYVVVNPPQ